MRKKEINGILNDLLDLMSWKNPLCSIWTREKIKFNLLTGKCNILEDDSIIGLLKEKRSWFLERIDNLGGNIEDFSKASIEVYGAEEKIEVIYKDEKFEKNIIYG